MLNGSREFCQEFLTDVRVPDTDRVGAVDDGWTVGTRWMVHERMLSNSPMVTRSVGGGQTGIGASFVSEVARDSGRIAEPLVRDLMGEARMLDLVDIALQRRISDGITSGAMSDQSAAIGRLFSGINTARVRSITFELGGIASAAWSDDDGELVFCGSDYLMRQVSCIGGGTTEMARNVISERVLGMPREQSHDRNMAFRDVPRSGSGRP
jgi:alkylation response protein AidB-like acyl-CoA dehydrogenase